MAQWIPGTRTTDHCYGVTLRLTDKSPKDPFAAIWPHDATGPEVAEALERLAREIRQYGNEKGV